MSTHTAPRPILDHIAILVSLQTLSSITTQLKDSLVVIDGGVHSDGLTVNKLTIFPDGTYIEFIAFTEAATPEKRKAHRWGSLEENKIADWAYTLPHESDFADVQRKVKETGNGIYYSDLTGLDRTRPDGVHLRFAVTSIFGPDGQRLFPGNAPFWCLDRTERQLRTPYRDPNGILDHAKHPSKIHGLSSVKVTVPEKDAKALKPVYDAIHSGQTWKFDSPDGSIKGSNEVTVSSDGDKSEIKVTFSGTGESPRSLEILPGLVIDFQATA